MAKKQGTAGSAKKNGGSSGRYEEVVANAVRMISQPSASVITVEVRVRLQALAIPEAVGGYSVIVPSLPGCVTQGETIEEVTANVIEAAEGWLAAGHDHNKDEDLRLARGE